MKRVQAWELFRRATFVGLVYDQTIMLNWLEADKADSAYMVCVVRHDDGSRDYLKGVLA